METKEHILLIHLLTQQNIFLKQLCDALVSRGALTHEDIRVFGDFLHSERPEILAAIDKMRNEYQREAKKLGVETGLEGPQEIPPTQPQL